MATIRVSGVDDIISDLQSIADDCDELSMEMLNAGAESAVQCWKDGIKANGHVDTGAMLESVGSKTKVQKGVRMVEIYPQGKDSKGVRNAEKAYVLHYGTSKMLGDRFVDKIDEQTETDSYIAMRNVYEEFLSKHNL